VCLAPFSFRICKILVVAAISAAISAVTLALTFLTSLDHTPFTCAVLLMVPIETTLQVLPAAVLADRRFLSFWHVRPLRRKRPNLLAIWYTGGYTERRSVYTREENATKRKTGGVLGRSPEEDRRRKRRKNGSSRISVKLLRNEADQNESYPQL
jgi:hypothetical protein